MYSFRISKTKTKYMEYKFKKRRANFTMDVKIEVNITPQVTQFNYLGSIIQNDKLHPDILI